MSQPVAEKDVYLDAEGNITTDAAKAAQQIAFKGSVISPHAKQRYGLNDDGSEADGRKKKSAEKDDADTEKQSKTLRTDSIKKVSPPAKK